MTYLLRIKLALSPCAGSSDWKTYETDTLKTVEKELLDKLLSLNYLNESDWEKLERLVNLLQSNFTCKVLQDFPMLSRDDIHIILLMRIGMKNIESQDYYISCQYHSV